MCTRPLKNRGSMAFRTANGDWSMRSLPSQARAAGRSPGHKRRGFTLIELLVVLAIVALLLTIVTPRYMASVERAKEVALKENLKVIRTSIDRFNGDKGHYPESLDELVTARYLRAVPLDPMTDSVVSWVLVPSDDPEVEGISDVKSGAQGTAMDGSAYTQW